MYAQKTVKLDRYKNASLFTEDAPGIFRELDSDLYYVTVFFQVEPVEDASAGVEEIASASGCWATGHLRSWQLEGKDFLEVEFAADALEDAQSLLKTVFLD